MAEERRHIRLLNQQTAASVRGSQVIGSVWRAIEELLRNAVEGGAKSCSLSVGKYDIVVCDDGNGIDPEAMRLFIGTDYCSNNSGAGGRTGESLRSIASLCVEMEIETSCWCSSPRQLVRCEKVFRGGSVVSFNQSFDENNSQSRIIPKRKETKELSGTTITLRGLFHQHAVRRKQTEVVVGSNALELNQIATSLRMLALCYPCVGFELKDQSTGKIVASYKTRSMSDGQSVESHALLVRLSEIYPNDFNEMDSTRISYKESTSFNAFGVVSILEDHENDVMMRNRELELVTINGRLATEAVRLAESVYSQIRTSPHVNPSSGVRFCIHVITATSNNLVLRDSVATTSVPQLDLLIKFLQKMVIRNGFGDEAKMCIMKKVSSERDIITNRSSCSSTRFQRAVEGQMIVSTSQDTNSFPDETTPMPSSPFSNAFRNEFKPNQSKEEMNSETKDFHSFEDAFLKQDSRIGNLNSNISNSTADDIDDFGQDSDVPSNTWSKQRIKSLENYIADITPDAMRNNKFTLTKQMLATAEVIAQLDLKYIIVKSGDILCAVDQHAADERVALEKLENSLCNHNGDTAIHMTKRSIKVADVIKLTRLLPSKRIILSQKQMSTVKHHWSLLQKWKFIVEEVGENTLLLTGVPSVCERAANVNDFFDFLQELSHVTGSNVKPAFVKNILASNACRYAVMFGDHLTRKQCVDLISRYEFEGTQVTYSITYVL